MQLLQPYESVRIPFICEQLNVSSNDVEELLVTLIHEGKISGKIDQVDQVSLRDALRRTRCPSVSQPLPLLPESG